MQKTGLVDIIDLVLSVHSLPLWLCWYYSPLPLLSVYTLNLCIYLLCDCSDSETFRDWCSGMHVPCKTCWQQSAVCSENGDAQLLSIQCIKMELHRLQNLVHVWVCAYACVCAHVNCCFCTCHK